MTEVRRERYIQRALLQPQTRLLMQGKVEADPVAAVGLEAPAARGVEAGAEGEGGHQVIADLDPGQDQDLVHLQDPDLDLEEQDETRKRRKEKDLLEMIMKREERRRDIFTWMKMVTTMMRREIATRMKRRMGHMEDLEKNCTIVIIVSKKVMYTMIVPIDKFPRKRDIVTSAARRPKFVSVELAESVTLRSIGGRSVPTESRVSIRCQKRSITSCSTTSRNNNSSILKRKRNR